MDETRKDMTGYKWDQKGQGWDAGLDTTGHGWDKKGPGQDMVRTKDMEI